MFICQNSGGICARAVNPPGFGIVPVQSQQPILLPIVLSAPVGKLGKTGGNRYPDVVTIQRALNSIDPTDGGARPMLIVDGDCGRNTKDAIQKFQVRHFGLRGADGLIEPGKQTLAKLNELMAKVIQNPPSMADLIRSWGLDPDSVLPDIKASFEQARGWILAARAAVLARSNLLDRHFRLSQQPNRQRALDHITFIFDQMQTVFQRPGGLWGVQTFQPEPVLTAQSENIGWCIAGGYYMGGQSDRGKHRVTQQAVVLRRDTVYVTWRFVITSGRARSYVIVHELAHFVSRVPEVTDHGYYHRGTVATLSPQQRLENADCFSMFAYEASTGNSISPTGV